jgi:uncharacterized RDD family membrane protein YckC
MRYAGVGRRAVALAIDWAISLVWAWPLAETRVGDSSFTFSLRGWPFVAWAVIWLAYFVILETAVGGTVGKLALGIRVRSATGARIGAGASLVRNLLRIVDAFPYAIPYLVGAIAVWTSSERRRIGDRAAGTVVVLAGAGTPQPPAPSVPAPPTPGAGDQTLPGTVPLPPPP